MGELIVASTVVLAICMLTVVFPLYLLQQRLLGGEALDVVTSAHSIASLPVLGASAWQLAVLIRFGPRLARWLSNDRRFSVRGAYEAAANCTPTYIVISLLSACEYSESK